MKILSFLFVFIQLLLLLPNDVLCPPTPSAADGQPKIRPNEPTDEQILFFIENLEIFLSEKCTDLKRSLSNITQIPFWPIEFIEKTKECIGKIKLGELVQSFSEKIQKQEKSSRPEIVETNVKQFWESLLQKLLKKVLGKEKQVLESLKVKQQFLVMRELFIIGEIFEKKVEKEFRADEELQEYLRAVQKNAFEEDVYDRYQRKKLYGIQREFPKYRNHIKEIVHGSSNSSFVYRTEIRWKFTAAVFLTESSLHDKRSDFSSFDLKEYFDMPENFPEHDAITEIRLTMEQLSVFIENLNNILSAKCSNNLNLNLFNIKRYLYHEEFKKAIQEGIDKMKIGELVNVFDEKNKQQQQAEQKLKKLTSSADGQPKGKAIEVTANEFLEKLLEKMLKKVPRQEKIALKQELDSLSDEQQLLILSELFTIGEHFARQLEENGSVGKGNDYGSVMINFGYHKEIQRKFDTAKEVIKKILQEKNKTRNFSSFDLKEHFVMYFGLRNSTKDEQFRIDIEPSLSQIAIFVENMDKFLHSICEFEESRLIEEKERENVFDQCISKLEISKIESFFNNESKNVKEFLGIIFEKILGHLHKTEANQQQLVKNLNEEEKWLILLKLFKLTYLLNEKLCDKLNDLRYELMDRNYSYLTIYDFEFYENKMKKFAAVEFVIRQKLEQEFKKSYNIIYYGYEQMHIKITFDPRNICGIKLKVTIATFTLANIIQIIGQFFKAKCSENMWKYFEDEKKLKVCAGKVKFVELDQKLSEETRKESEFIKYFVNLIMGILKNNALIGKEAKHQQLNPYKMNIYSQIDKAGLEMKLPVLKGLLQFGRLFTEKFGILAMENIDLDKYRTITWNGIPITIKRNHFASLKTDEQEVADELESINDALKKAGLLEAMDEELRENRVKLLKSVGVPEEKIQMRVIKTEESKV